ncbi:SusD/RagB family nutrient-binding outer membrane lipoprotein [Arcticibacter eurypsychrophilus]|uniref:SusD/RagB family nutrient-binding outer membrane lipoprotein n=1 Tax=Arcticibacter eurypsychrophilus TaxID=1434752 RepID=UPI00084D2ED8|nr:SusD/RagB family nutrient-binding outer membrane lipoprotein [Arcticibacter eurypsychrophilus]
MKRKHIILCTLIILLSACTKNFEQINTNPNSPDQITNPGLLLTNIIRSVANNNLSNSFDRGSVAADQLASPYASNFINWTRNDANSYFCWNYYNYIRDLNEIITVADAQKLNNYKGIALVLRSWMFQNLTDLYGPIPFREAASSKTTGINKPKYEQQEVVYAGLLNDLEEAVTLMGTSKETVIGDIMFAGDQIRWKKFATGMTLRLLMRQSGKVNPTSKMTAILANPSKYPLFQSHEDQAALQYLGDRLENEMPFYRGSNSDYGISTRISANLNNYLSTLNDSRLFVLAIPASVDNKYHGAVNGTGDWDDPAKYSAPGMLWAPRQYNDELASPTAAQSVFYSYSEEQFILAEAAEKGFISGGSTSAATYYHNGISDQFSYYASRIPANYSFPKPADIVAGADYYAQTGVVYTGTTDQKLRKIYLQKWISLFLNGFEAWSEWRRTGFPNIQVGPVSSGYVPVRCLYPADEQRINEANYQEAVSWLGADDMKSKVWWDAN